MDESIRSIRLHPERLYFDPASAGEARATCSISRSARPLPLAAPANFLYRSTQRAISMNRKSLASAAILLTLSATSAFAATWKGTISDEMCGAQHVNATAKDIACAQKCVKGGSPAVLIVGDQVYKIENQDAVKDHVGHKVIIVGTMSNSIIHVDAVKE
jgi:hypothetical protein